ncbi:MAG: NAD(+)/NADH kinase [Phycisphaerales bacterium]|nr:NAD(+)/NADH kinase [Phycisphaerales bacterium]
MRVLVIHNAKAGYEQADAPAIMALIRKAGHDPVYQSGMIDDLHTVLDEPWDLVVAAGGDGTATRVLKACAGLDLPVALLPLGTANNTAHALGHVGTLEHLVQAWTGAARVRIDLGIVESNLGRAGFAESFGIGLMAQTIVTADKGDSGKARAKFASVAERLDSGMKAMRKTLKTLEPRRLRVRTADGQIDGQYLWLEVGTFGMVGPRIPLVHADDYSDGLLTYALLPASQKDTFAEFLGATHGGSAPTRTGLVTGRTPSLQAEWSGFPAHLDGTLLEDLGRSDDTVSVSVRVRPKTVTVLKLTRG